MSSSANSNGGNSISTHTFQPNIKVNFANQQISLSSKFIESVTSKIKQLKEEASKEPDEQKKMAIINKHQNIETMLKNSLMEYKQKLQQQKQQQQAQNQQQQPQNQQKVQQQQTQQNPQQTQQIQQTQQNAQQTNTNADAANNSYVSIKNYLTEEQKLQYANINKQFQQKIQQIVSTYDNNKKELEKILEKIKATNPDTMQTEMGELMTMKTKCENNGKTLQAAYKNLESQMGDLKKRFYLKCSETNVELKKALMMAQMSQRQRQGNPQQQQPQQQEQQQEQTNTQPSNKISVQSAPSSTPAPKKPTPSQTATPVSTQPKAAGENILKPSINENSFLPDVSSTIKPVPIKETSYKKDPTQPTISGGYLGSNPILSQPLNRILPQPVSTSAGAQGAASVTAAGGGKKNAYIPTLQDHILTKRKLRDLLKQYNGNSANIDGDVEELLLDLSDNFIEQVVKFGGKVAKLRKSENLEVKDVKFALEKGFGLEL